MPMLAGMGVLAAACVGLGLVPGGVASGLNAAVGAAGLRGKPIVQRAINLRLAGASGVISPVLLAVGLLAATVVVVGVARAFERVAGSTSGRELGLWSGVADGTDGVHRDIVRRAAAACVRRRVAPGPRPRRHPQRRSRAGTSRRSEYQTSIVDGIDQRAYQPAFEPCGGGANGPAGCRTAACTATSRTGSLPCSSCCWSHDDRRTYASWSCRSALPSGAAPLLVGLLRKMRARSRAGPARRSSSRGVTCASSGRRNGSCPSTRAGSFGRAAGAGVERAGHRRDRAVGDDGVAARSRR